MTAGRIEGDTQMLARLRDGDDRAFAELVANLSPALMRLAMLHVPSRAVAEEVVQDTWLAVVSGLDGFEGRSALRTWIFRILLNRARSTGVREHRSVPFSSAWGDDALSVPPQRFQSHRASGRPGVWSDPPVPWYEAPEDRATASEVRQLIETVITELPVRQREVVTARDLLGLDADEVCVLFDLSMGNQRVLLHRGRSRVRGVLERYFQGDRT